MYEVGKVFPRYIQWGVISVRAQTTPNVIFFAELLYSNYKINSIALK